MQEILRLQKKIVPELVELLDKRYNVLRTIYYNQPIGRRILANQLSLGERIVRTEINFLNSQGLININTAGMSVTPQGEEVVNELKEFIHEIKGLSEVEESLKELLNVKKVIIVPGDVEENNTILKDLGKACSNYLKDLIKDNNIIALTGGGTIKAVVEEFPKVNNISNVLVLPARGGMGRKVETQANTLAATLAKKLNGSYRMLHIPENLSLELLDTLSKEQAIKEVIENIHKADIMLYGIGNAIEMANKRGVSEEHIERLQNLGAIGEAFGCYFDKNSRLIEETNNLGLHIYNARKNSTHIAVAGGKNKVDSIISTQLNDETGVLVTDEAAARLMYEILSNKIN
ncbi:MAG: sugar-binding transcriptional regulator [Clostridium sp.]